MHVCSHIRKRRGAQKLCVQVTVGISGLLPSCNASPEKHLTCWKMGVRSSYNPETGFRCMEEFLANATSSLSAGGVCKTSVG